MESNFIGAAEDCCFDFTFDVSSLFDGSNYNALKREEVESSEAAIAYDDFKEEDVEADFTLDISEIIPPPEKTPDQEEPLNHAFASQEQLENKLAYDEEDFVIDHEENVPFNLNDTDSGPELFRRKKLKVDPIVKKLVSHNAALLNSICWNNCEPFLAPAHVNESHSWIGKQQLIKELSESEIYQFYNGHVDEILEQKFDKRKRKRTSTLDFCSMEQLSSNFSRTLLNEIIMAAEENDCLSVKDVKSVHAISAKFVHEVFKRLIMNAGSKTIDQKTAQKVCLSLLSHDDLKEDFLGELVNGLKCWAPSKMKYKYYKRDIAVNTQLDGLGNNIKKYLYAKNILVKDLRLHPK